MSVLKHSQKTLVLDRLEDVTWTGLHSLECRRAGLSGNPSERFRELAADGVRLRKRREKLDGTWGIRVWLERFAPKDSTPIEPSDTELGGDNPPTQARTAGGTPPVAVELGAGRRRSPEVAYGWYFDRDTGELLRRPLSAIEFLAGLDEGQLTGARSRAAAA